MQGATASKLFPGVVMFSSKINIVFLVVLLSACSGQFQDEENSSVNYRETANEEQLSEIEKKELEQYIEGYLVKRDASGKIISIEGYEESRKLKNHESTILTSEELSSLINDEDEVVTFDAPDGTDAEISAPTMIIGSNLFNDAENTLDCGSLDYGDEGASLSQVFSLAMVNDVCGKVSLGFCIRIVSKDGVNARKERYTYIPAPPIRLTISCDDPYKDLTLPSEEQEGKVINELGAPITIIDGDLTNNQVVNDGYTNDQDVVLQFNAVGADQMYVTNNPKCEDDDRDWVPYQASISRWKLPNINAENKVYVKFRQGDNETVCYEDSIVHDNLTPTKVTSIEYASGGLLNNYTPLFSIDGSQDTGSGILGYEMSVGTSEDNNDISAWSLVSNTNNFNLANEDLANYSWGEEYYVNIRAIDKAGNISEPESKLFTVGFRELGLFNLQSASAEQGPSKALASYNKHIVVGSSLAGYDRDGEFLSNAGIVRIFRQDAAGTVLEATLKAPNPDADDNFGHSVAIYGDFVVIGAPGEDSDPQSRYIYSSSDSPSNNLISKSGAAYVFKRSVSSEGSISWQHEVTIKAENADEDDQFGFAVGIYASYIAIGAPGEDSDSRGIFKWNSDTSFDNNNAGGLDSGAVYLVERKDSRWQHTSFLKHDSGNAGDQLPQALAFSDNTIVVGSRFIGSSADSADTNNPGGAVVFTNTGNSWVQQASLKPDSLQVNARFGDSVAVSENRVAIGAIGENSYEGSVYLFENNGTTWNQELRLNPAYLSSGDQFGYSIGLKGKTLIVGANQEDSSAGIINGNFASLNTNLENSGAVFVYYFSTQNSWTQRSLLKPESAKMLSFFGSAVCISETLIIAGSKFSENSLGFGSLYLFGY